MEQFINDLCEKVQARFGDEHDVYFTQNGSSFSITINDQYDINCVFINKHNIRVDLLDDMRMKWVGTVHNIEQVEDAVDTACDILSDSLTKFTEQKIENHWDGDSIQLRKDIFDWLYSDDESGYDIEEFPLQDNNRQEEFGYGDVAIVPMEVSGYRISYNQDYVNSHEETAGDRYIAEVFFMNGKYILFGRDKDFRYEGETVEEFEEDFIDCLGDYDESRE